MPPSERPRERMLTLGERALTNSELLAVIIGSGTRSLNAVEVAAQILSHVNGQLSELSSLGPHGMRRVSGMGPEKSLKLCACAELARRIALEHASANNNIINTPQDAYENLQPLFGSDRSEECWALFLKNNKKILGSLKVSSGGESMTHINHKSIVRRALDVGAKCVILSHNHPTGNVDPSMADIKATETLTDALHAFDITLMDHIILGTDSYFSFSTNKTYGKVEKNVTKCKKVEK